MDNDGDGWRWIIDGWVDGKRWMEMDGWTGGWIKKEREGWTDRWMDGWR